jgi:hypothetical protein
MGNHNHHQHHHHQYNQLNINNLQNTNTNTTKSTTTTTILPSPSPKYPKTSHNETSSLMSPQLPVVTNNFETTVNNNDTPNKNSFSFSMLDSAYIRHIQAETRRFSSMLTQSDIECKSVTQMNSSRLAKNIIEICQMSTTHSSTSPVVLQARINKIRKVLRVILNGNCNKNENDDNEEFNDDDDDDDDEGEEREEKSFYDMCLHEACVQLCQLKPTLLTRGDDLIRFGKRILQNCSIVDIERQNDEEKEDGDQDKNKKPNASSIGTHESSQLANPRYFSYFLIKRLS